MPLRIALTHAHSWPEVRRGGERYLHELADALARRGHSVTIFGGASRWSLRREEGVRLVRIRRPVADDPAAGEGRFARRLVPLLLPGRYDVVHSLGPRDAVASLYARRLRRGRRTVYTCLGNPVRSWWDTRPDGWAHDSVVEGIDVYGCLSRYARGHLRRDYGRTGALTPGGVRLDRFRPRGARSETPTLLFSGALTEGRKGLGLLLEAIPHLAEFEPRVRLWLSGSGDPSRLLEAAPPEARERTEVLPLGTPEDQPERYGTAWATVLPSKDEAFGLVLVESLACGTPIVGVRHGAVPELVGPGIGALAPPDDPRALAEACAEALSLTAEREATERCRDAAMAHGWDEAVAPAIEALYRGEGRDDAAPLPPSEVVPRSGRG